MPKSGNRVHGTIHGRIRKGGTTKKFLLECMSSEGWELVETDKMDVGEWNERVEFRAVKGERECFLGSRFKGGAMDWRGAVELFHTSTNGLGWTWKQFEESRENW